MPTRYVPGPWKRRLKIETSSAVVEIPPPYHSTYIREIMTRTPNQSEWMGVWYLEDSVESHEM